MFLLINQVDITYTEYKLICYSCNQRIRGFPLGVETQYQRGLITCRWSVLRVGLLCTIACPDDFLQTKSRNSHARWVDTDIGRFRQTDRLETMWSRTDDW